VSRRVVPPFAAEKRHIARMTQVRTEERRIGRPPKGQGPRANLRGEVPVAIKRAAEQRAAALGLHVCDYLAYLVSADTGEQIPGQEALPLAERRRR